MSAGWDPSSTPQHPPYSDYAAQAVMEARARVDLAGIMLLVLGVLSLLGPALFGLRAVQLMLTSEEQYAAQTAEAKAMVEKLLGQAAGPMPGKNQVAAFTLIGTFILLTIALTFLLAGLQMRQLKSYALALTGSILALVPCLSWPACCGIGQMVGIWALVVLIDPQVRLAFSVTAMPPVVPPAPNPTPPVNPTDTPERGPQQ